MENRLVRVTDDRVFAGVAGGLARYLNVDPTLVRLAFVIFFFLGVSASFWIYLILWIIMPEE